MIDEMIRENWAGMMGSVGNQIKNMMQSQGTLENTEGATMDNPEKLIT
jgi:hypothetical protein